MTDEAQRRDAIIRKHRREMDAARLAAFDPWRDPQHRAQADAIRDALHGFMGDPALPELESYRLGKSPERAVACLLLNAVQRLMGQEGAVELLAELTPKHVRDGLVERRRKAATGRPREGAELKAAAWIEAYRLLAVDPKTGQHRTMTRRELIAALCKAGKLKCKAATASDYAGRIRKRAAADPVEAFRFRLAVQRRLTLIHHR